MIYHVFYSLQWGKVWRKAGDYASKELAEAHVTLGEAVTPDDVSFLLVEARL